MPIKHIVAQGESISSLAEKYGFAPETIWQFPDNRSLREARLYMDVLMPGDTVVIPDKQPKTVQRENNQLHKFWRKGVPAKLRLRLLTGGEPRGDTPYRLVIDGRPTPGVTDRDGWLEQPVPNGARKAQLVLEDGDSFELQIGHLNPVTTPSGVRARLLNLGYLAPGEETDEAVAEAVKTMQAKHRLEETGQLDEETRRVLVAEYGC